MFDAVPAPTADAISFEHRLYLGDIGDDREHAVKGSTATAKPVSAVGARAPPT